MSSVSNRSRAGLFMRTQHGALSTINRQRGASLIEFSIVGLSAILLGMFTLQIGLLYHAKTTINYAVFEAARAGAVNNASMSAIEEELGIRLAPLQGGDGTASKAAMAVVNSVLKIKDPLNTQIVILNPTKAAFRDWSVKDPVTGENFIPVNHLRHQSYDIGTHSGLSLRDATLLKVQVTHGVDLRVPVVGKLISGPMQWIDSKNAAFYLRDKWPIQSVATVRMQSDSFESEILKSASRDTKSDDGQGSDGTNEDENDASGPDGRDTSDDVEVAQSDDGGGGGGGNGSGQEEEPTDTGGGSGPEGTTPGLGNEPIVAAPARPPPRALPDDCNEVFTPIYTASGSDRSRGSESPAEERSVVMAEQRTVVIAETTAPLNQTLNQPGLQRQMISTSRFRELLAQGSDEK